MTAIRHRPPSPRAARQLAVAIVGTVLVIIGALAIATRVFGAHGAPGAHRAPSAHGASSWAPEPAPAAPAGGAGSPASGLAGVRSADPPSPSTVPSTALTAAASKAAPAPKPPAPKAPAPKPPAPNAPAPNVPARPASAPEAAVLLLVNAERAKVGCGALTADARLTSAAHGHSADMASRGYFAHDSPEGVTMATRITNAGYRWSAVAENIGMGYSSPASVMRGWMNSTGHRTNILHCAYRNIGIGVAVDAGGSEYWTQDFGTPA